MIEPKGIFIEVIVQMLMAYSSLMDSDQPSLHQGSHSVTQRQEIIPYGTILAHDLMKVGKMLQTYYIHSTSHRSSRYCQVQRPWRPLPQAPCRDVCDTLQPDSATTLITILLRRNDHQHFFSAPRHRLSGFSPPI